jgi:hypothetical protein
MICHRCERRPAVCVIGVTRLTQLGSHAKSNTGRFSDAPLEALGLLYSGSRSTATVERREGRRYMKSSAWLELCPICSGRI